MEPPPHDPENRMTYVVAFEEDGYSKDVTPRYARDYWAKTLKKRAGTKSGKTRMVEQRAFAIDTSLSFGG